MTRRGPEHGQGLVEFCLAITVLLLLLMGIIDLGRAVYQLNGVSSAARELARVASVHPGATLGSSTETSSTLATQRGLVPGLATPSYACVDITGASVTGTCQPGSWVKVSLNSTFIPVTPVASFLGTIVVTGTASAKIE